LFPEFAEEEKRLEAEAGGAAGGHNGSSSSSSSSAVYHRHESGHPGGEEGEGASLLFPQTAAVKRSYAHMTDGNTSSAFVLQGSMNPSIYSFAHHHAFAAPATGAGAGAGIYRPNSSSLLGGYRAPRPAAATPAAEGGSGGNDDSFEGLTLRVAPAEPDGGCSGGGAEQALPALLKPLLRVSARTVSVDKIQRFIHKRMLA